MSRVVGAEKNLGEYYAYACGEMAREFERALSRDRLSPKSFPAGIVRDVQELFRQAFAGVDDKNASYEARRTYQFICLLALRSFSPDARSAYRTNQKLRKFWNFLRDLGFKRPLEGAEHETVEELVILLKAVVRAERESYAIILVRPSCQSF